MATTCRCNPFAKSLCGEAWNDEMSLTVSHTQTILNVLQSRQKNAVCYLCDFPATYVDMVIYKFIIIYYHRHHHHHLYAGYL